MRVTPPDRGSGKFVLMLICLTVAVSFRLLVVDMGFCRD